MKACLLLAGTPEGTLIWNGQPPIDFAGDLARIQAGYTAVRALAIEADTDNSRTTDDKAEAEDILEALTLQMAAALRNRRPHRRSNRHIQIIVVPPPESHRRRPRPRRKPTRHATRADATHAVGCGIRET